MTWEIFVGITVLVAFVISIGKIVANNTRAMAEMKTSLDELKESLREQKQDINTVKASVQNHETRITVLEKQ